MEKRKLLQSLIGSLVGSTLLFSCTSEELSRDIDNVENELLTISSEQNVYFDIEYNVPKGYRVVFDVYAENPYQVTSEGAYKKEISPVISGMTDEHGRYQLSRVVSAGVKEVFVVSKSVGTPMLLHGVVESGNVKPVEKEFSSLVQAQDEMDSRTAAFSPYYLGTWNYWGRPNYIDASKTCNITKDELRTISKSLPEWKRVDKDYVEADFIYVKKEAEVWVSLLSAKSLFNNALGYYCYEEGMTKNDVKEIIAIPRTDISWFEKKSLKSGEYVKLKYLNPQTNQFEDKFPAGSRIGWVLHRSGFRCLNSQVNNGTYQFYSNSEWNPEKTNKEHTAIFSTKEGNVILGFEDVYNESLFADNDCNDVIFHIASLPEDAISAEIEIPDVSTDVVEEDVDVVQNLSMIVDIPAADELANNLVVASKSTMEVEDGNVVGVKDVLYIANSSVMKDMITHTYTMSEMERKVVVRTTVKFARAAAEEEEKKGRTVVRTTVKNTTWEVDEANSRTVMNYTGDISDLILLTVENYRQQLAEGKCIRLEIIMQFEGVGYEQFVGNIDVPPYSPFIENVAE